MKKKLIVFISIAFVLVAAGTASVLTKDILIRYHQHISTPKPQCTQTEEDFCSNLPIVSVNAYGKTPEVVKKYITSEKYHRTSTKLDCEIEIFDSPDNINHLTNTPNIKTRASYRYRGYSSLLFDKKSYKLNFVKEDGLTNNEIQVMGMSEHDEWVLNGPFLDKSLMRNYLCMNIAGEIMPNTPQVRYCELFINGQYQGLYLAIESIEWDDERLSLTKNGPGDLFSSYILRSDRDYQQPNSIYDFNKYTHKISESVTMEIIYPSIQNLTPHIKDYIEKEISTYEKALYSFDYNTEDYGYTTFLETDSFVDYFIINEFFGNRDAGIFSTYFYKDLRGKLKIGPVWDFNNSCSNYSDKSVEINEFSMPTRPWYYMLLKDEDFVEEIISTYRELRRGILSEEYLINYIDSTRAWLGDAVERNFEMWGYSFDISKVDDDNKLFPEQRNPKDYEDAVKDLKDYIIERGNWLDKNIEVLKQYSHESKNKKFNH